MKGIDVKNATFLISNNKIKSFYRHKKDHSTYIIILCNFSSFLFITVCHTKWFEEDVKKEIFTSNNLCSHKNINSTFIKRKHLLLSWDVKKSVTIFIIIFAFNVVTFLATAKILQNKLIFKNR